MADIELAEYRTTVLYLKPESHARLTRMAKEAKMRKSELIRMMVNKGLNSYPADQRPSWLYAG